MRTSHVGACFAVIFALAACPLRAGEEDAARATANMLLSQPGVRHGLVVYIGNGDLATALLRNGVQIVHGLSTDAKTVTETRDFVRRHGRHGPVSASLWTSALLPYADDLVNVIVVEDARLLREREGSVAECIRILAPFGTLFLASGGADGTVTTFRKAGLELRPFEGSGGAWMMGRKAFSAQMDEWPHYFHDAGHTNVSKDSLVGPATGFRWIQGHFGMVRDFHPIQGAVFASGRSFYVRYLAGAQTLARQGGPVLLQAHDAFNGLKLWEREIWSEPTSVLNSRQTGPVVADGSVLFVQLEKEGVLVALDAATGAVRRRYGTAGAPESCYRGFPVLREGHGAWAVLDPESGKVARRFSVEESYADSPILIGEGRVVLLRAGAGETGAAYRRDAEMTGIDWWKQFHEEEKPARGEIICFDFDTGEELWCRPNVGDGRLFWLRHGLIVTRRGNTMNGISAEDGRHLWENTVGTKKGGYPALFHFGELLWGYSDGRWYYAYNPQTGERLWSDRGRWKEFGRCGTDRATERFILGMDFSIYDLRDQDGTYKEDKSNAWDCFFARADCGSSYYPANGLYYSYGHVCACGVYVHGILGVSCTPLPDMDELRRGAGPDFVKGPAFGKDLATAPSTDDDWPTFRHDRKRSAATNAQLPAAVGSLWRTKLDAPPSAPVAVGDAVFVACPDAHQVVALDAATGAVRWEFTAGARVDSPPTWHDGLLLFGARDGWVYCLSAEDGALAWKRRVAPADRLISVRNQLESLWPLYGAVLVDSGLAYVSAGRHGDADGGVFFQALEPGTGRVVWERNIRGFPPYRESPYVRLIEGRKTIPHSGYDADVLSALDPEMLAGIGFSFRNDVLIGDGRTIFLSSIGLDMEEGSVTGAPQGVALFNPSGDLLTDSDLTTNKTRWILAGDPKAPSWRSRRGAKPVAQGRLLSLAGSSVISADGRNLNLGRRRLRLADGLYPFALVACDDRVMVACRNTGTEAAPGQLLTFAMSDGDLLAQCPVDTPPTFDGMAVAHGRVFIAGIDGSLVCMSEKGASSLVEEPEDATPVEPERPMRGVAISLPPEDARTQMLMATGLPADGGAELATALKDADIGVVVAGADPATLRFLAENSELQDAFHARGGWLMLWGLEPEGLGAFNRIVGVEHLIRPYEIERVRLPADTDPLLEGVTGRDLDLTTEERFGHIGDQWPDPEAYGYVVDVDDIAPFCTWPEPKHFRCPGQPKSDRWPRNMVNGMWEFWKGGFVIDLRLGSPTNWTVHFPRKEKVNSLSLVPGFGYGKIRRIHVGFGGNHKPVVLDIERAHARQTFELPPTVTDRLKIAIIDWEPSAANPIVGVDNMWITVERHDEFRQKVKPLASIGVLVKYPRGKGGILLNQITARDDATIAALAATAAEGAEDPVAARRQATNALQNLEKQKKVLVQKLLRNLSALP